ncbi:unannotated protein [freshwater metagenome]|uniref:Unannotated protein n=1 Tax=freshwater metagenome TaxID=449393 RepID=A0A6J7N8V3_9ZZZZ
MRTMALTWSLVFTPSIERITEPAGMPAFSAPSPGTSLRIFAPTPVYVASRFTPNTGRVDLPVAIISSITRFASFIGIENPSPMLPAVPPLESVAIAEFTPIILPCASKSAPPELPGLIAASV